MNYSVVLIGNVIVLFNVLNLKLIFCFYTSMQEDRLIVIKLYINRVTRDSINCMFSKRLCINLPSKKKKLKKKIENYLT